MIVKSYENMRSGDYVICEDDTDTLYVTKNKKYFLEDIIDIGNEILLLIIDDGNQLSTHKVNKFISIYNQRNLILDSLIKIKIENDYN